MGIVPLDYTVDLYKFPQNFQQMFVRLASDININIQVPCTVYIYQRMDTFSQLSDNYTVARRLINR